MIDDTTTVPSEPTEPTEPTRRPRRRGRRVAKTGVVVFVLATAGVVTVATLGLGEDAAPSAASELPPATATVTRETLADTRSEDGELGYGPSSQLSGRLPGTITRMPADGATIARGKPVYWVDNQPVLLMYGALPAYRPLADGVTGPDVRQFEENLAALGYPGFTVDDDYSARTATAVKEWQEDLGLTETGTVELGRVIFNPAAIRVDSTAANTGDQAVPGQPVLAYTGTAKAVTLELDPGDRELAEPGREVGVRLPDGAVVKGTVTSVSSYLKPAAQGQDAETKLRVVVGLADDQARTAAEGYGQAGVEVEFTAGTRENVLTVPVAALLALAEGGFGVEVVDGQRTEYVPVETGLFADGRVEISGAGITEGTTVGMPE